MSLVDKVGRENLLIWGSLLALHTVSVLVPFSVGSYIKAEWSRSASVVKENGPLFSIYGYDHDRDNVLDEIKVLRFGSTGIQLLLLDEQYTRNDVPFLEYERRLIESLPEKKYLNN